MELIQRPQNGDKIILSSEDGDIEAEINIDIDDFLYDVDKRIWQVSVTDSIEIFYVRWYEGEHAWVEVK